MSLSGRYALYFALLAIRVFCGAYHANLNEDRFIAYNILSCVCTLNGLSFSVQPTTLLLAQQYRFCQMELSHTRQHCSSCWQYFIAGHSQSNEIWFAASFTWIDQKGRM